MVRDRVSRLVSGILVLVCAVTMSGCASIVSGGPGKINVKSNPDGAKLTIYDARKNEQISTGTTPHTATLERGAGFFKGAQYRLVLEKAGYKQQEVFIASELNGWYLGNLLFGGIIGLLIVDPLTGAMYVLRPKDVSVDLVKQTGAIPGSNALAVRLERIEDLPADVRARLEPAGRLVTQ